MVTTTTKEVFTERANAFLNRVLGTFPTTVHKFLGAVALKGAQSRIRELVASLADASGNVDVRKVKEAVDAGFAASGGEFTLKLGQQFAMLGVEPLTVRLTKNDSDQFFGSLG